MFDTYKVTIQKGRQYLNMKDTFIERATKYPLECGKLVVYESNTQCANVAFKFDHHVMTLMLAGHKSVVAEGVRFEFFPGTFFIPQKDVIQKVDIPSASTNNPTMCLELDLDASFIKSYYEAMLQSEHADEIFRQNDESKEVKDFISNDKKLINAYKRIYERRMLGDSVPNQMVVTLMIKGLLLDLFQTDALDLYMQDFETVKISKPIKKSLAYIKGNIDKKITAKQLSEVADMGLTSFFNKFKKEMDIAPMEYLTLQRITLAKSFLRNGDYSLKEAAFNSGFKSYEHFCVTFKKLEKMTPSNYKNTLEVV